MAIRNYPGFIVCFMAMMYWTFVISQGSDIPVAELTLDTGSTCTPGQASITMHHPDNAPVEQIIIYDPYTYTVAQIRNIQSLLDIDDRREYQGRIAFSTKEKETNTYEVIIHDMTKKDEGIYDVEMHVSSGSMAKGSISLVACSDAELEPSISVNYENLAPSNQNKSMILNTSDTVVMLLTGRRLKADITLTINANEFQKSCSGTDLCTLPISLPVSDGGNLTIQYQVTYLDQCAPKNGVRQLFYISNSRISADGVEHYWKTIAIIGIILAIILPVILIVAFTVFIKIKYHKNRRRPKTFKKDDKDEGRHKFAENKDDTDLSKVKRPVGTNNIVRHLVNYIDKTQAMPPQTQDKLKAEPDVNMPQIASDQQLSADRDKILTYEPEGSFAGLCDSEISEQKIPHDKKSDNNVEDPSKYDMTNCEDSTTGYDESNSLIDERLTEHLDKSTECSVDIQENNPCETSDIEHDTSTVQLLPTGQVYKLTQ